LYATCIFCHSGLGANEAIEHFPVGRRLAFDAAKGRLWVVCRECERWNLSPLEERWEAIEECERLFRDTKLRVSTDNIGLARLKEGTTLVRVGDPQRPEMAAWRYGDQFNRRRRKYYMLVGGGVVVAGGLIAGGLAMGAIGAGSFQLVQQLINLRKFRTAARLPLQGTVLRVGQRDLERITLKPDGHGGFEMKIRHKPLTSAGFLKDWNPAVVLSGDEAISAARHLLPRINRAGGSTEDVTDAVHALEQSGDTQKLFTSMATRYRTTVPKRDSSPSRWSWPVRTKLDGGAVIKEMPASVRLALEMSLHEEDERRALEGELYLLEDRWREAEEVAAISDDMFLPASVDAILKKLKRS
jgi:hypothetical protein